MTFNSDIIKCNMAQDWHKNVPLILIYPDVNMRSAFHKIQALALTNGISGLQIQWSDSGKYTKGTKCTRGKSKHDHAWMHMLLIAVCANAHRNTHMYSTHTHTHTFTKRGKATPTTLSDDSYQGLPCIYPSIQHTPSFFQTVSPLSPLYLSLFLFLPSFYQD